MQHAELKDYNKAVGAFKKYVNPIYNYSTHHNFNILYIYNL